MFIVVLCAIVNRQHVSDTPRFLYLKMAQRQRVIGTSRVADVVLPFSANAKIANIAHIRAPNVLNIDYNPCLCIIT